MSGNQCDFIHPNTCHHTLSDYHTLAASPAEKKIKDATSQGINQKPQRRS